MRRFDSQQYQFGTRTFRNWSWFGVLGSNPELNSVTPVLIVQDFPLLVTRVIGVITWHIIILLFEHKEQKGEDVCTFVAK